MSLNWLTYAKELAAKAPLLTGDAARCGDPVYNLSNGTYSIDQFAEALRYVGGEKLVTAINSISPFVSNTTLSDIACAIETKTGLPAPACGALTAATAYAGFKALQWGYTLYNVNTPIDLIKAILEKHALALLNIDYKKLAQTFDSILDGKVDSLLEDLKTRFPEAYNVMSQKDKDAYVAEAKKQEMKKLDVTIGQKKDDIQAAVAQSQVPTATMQTKAVAGMQESTLNLGAFNLQNALSTILYGVNLAAPVIRQTNKATV